MSELLATATTVTLACLSLAAYLAGVTVALTPPRTLAGRVRGARLALGGLTAAFAAIGVIWYGYLHVPQLATVISLEASAGVFLTAWLYATAAIDGPDTGDQGND